MEKLVSTLLSILFWYLIISFVTSSWNPLEWHVGVKILVVFILILIFNSDE